MIYTSCFDALEHVKPAKNAHTMIKHKILDFWMNYEEWELEEDKAHKIFILVHSQQSYIQLVTAITAEPMHYFQDSQSLTLTLTQNRQKSTQTTLESPQEWTTT